MLSGPGALPLRKEFKKLLDRVLSISPFMQGLLLTPSATAARTALGAAASGANSDITSLSGLTTPLSIAQGGTNANTALLARVALEATRTMNPIDATVAANALTIAIKPNASEFRSATLSSGLATFLANAADLTLVVPNGATLGTTNGAKAILAVLEINNAGTKEAAVVNLAGGVNINEAGVISTTTISTGADLSTVVYSTTGRSNVPYRIVGFIEITEATAGTWATAPSLVDGGSAPLAKWLSGYGQTWQLVTRTAGVTYDNLTGRNITMVKNINAAAAASCSASIAFNGGAAISFLSASAGTGPSGCAGSIVIPAGSSYVLAEVNVTATNNYELR